MNVEFAFGNQLNAKLEKIISDAKESLILISPFIDLDPRIKDALSKKKQSFDFQLRVLFGKNELEKGKSIKSDSLDFLKTFDNVEIRYNSRLHAKFYMNDYEFLISSMNLYNYSLANNIEVGVIGQHKHKGLFQLLLKSPDEWLNKKFSVFRSETFGSDREVNPIEEFSIIYNNSEAYFQKTNGIINIDQTKAVHSLTTTKPISEHPAKLVSATKLSEILKIPANEINRMASESGLICNGVITQKGIALGLESKTFRTTKYIAYPENLMELLKRN